MAEINEEFIAEYSRVIGNAFFAINQGIGNENIPGSAIFNLNQLSYLVDKKTPAFGIVQQTNASAGFFVEIDDSDTKFLKISSGKIAYLDNLISVPAQRLSIVKNFASSYPTNNVYGMRIGFPITEAQKITNAVYSSVLKENLTTTQNVVYIENPQRIINLGFPITAYIGINTYVVFESATSDRSGLIIDPAINGGFVTQSFDKGTSINFIYEPKIKSLFGLPVAVNSLDPAEFLYYPPMPKEWLHIADILIENPQNPEVASFGDEDAILRKAIDYPAANLNPPLFSATDAQIIKRYVDSAKSQLLNTKNRSSVGDSIKALEYYTSALQESSGQTFRQFWASRPLAVSTYYNKGVNYDGLERFEFSDNFSDAYYSINGKDLNRTFAIFRGDLYANPSTIYGSPPSTVSISSISDFKGITSSISNGTYYYGVSAVLTTGETRETPITVSSIITTPNASNYVNVVQWTPVTNAQFYHIYRKSTQSGEQIDYRLTDVNTIKGAGPFVNETITPNDSVNLTTAGIAFKIKPSGISEMHLGGIYFRLKGTDVSLNNLTGHVSVKLYTNVDDKPGLEITEANFDNISFETIFRNKFGILSNDYKKIVLKTNYKISTGSNTWYWIVLTLSEDPSAGNIQLHVSNAAQNDRFATFTAGTWSLIDNITAFYELLGFVDNGIKGTAIASKGLYLTKKITKEPRRLRIFLPRISSFPTFAPTFGVFADVEETPVTKNDLVVTVTAQNGTDDPVILPSITIPQNTSAETQFLLGTANQIFDRVVDVQVSPGINVVRGAANSILWSKYDTFVVENVP